MLSHLIIDNFAIIDRLELPFEAGYTVVTGETGTGKSIMIDALNLLLGGRASTDVIRTDEDEAGVEGIFEPADPRLDTINRALDEQGINTGDELIIRRRLRRNGRNKVFINGSLSTVSTLREITSDLVDISGQHEHYSLLDTSGHLDLVDLFGDLGELRDDMRETYEQLESLAEQLDDIQSDEQERLNRIDFLEYQLDEIEQLNLDPGEGDELQQEFDRLKHAESIGESVGQALEVTYEGNRSAVELLSDAVSHLQEAASHDDDLSGLIEDLEDARITAEEIARQLQSYSSDLEVNPARLDTVVERLDELQQLQRKHGVDSTEALLEKADEMRDEILRLKNAEQRGEELREALRAQKEDAFQTARELSAARRESADTFAEQVEAELSDLNMEQTEFTVDVAPHSLPPESPSDDNVGVRGTDLAADEPTVTLSSTGFDSLEFVIAPNPGEEARPLADIASGGELSRIMLAIKSVLVDRDSVETYVFDEVDTGIGGTTAEVVGRKIRRTADSHQIICITHLAQIASLADQHYRVTKQQRNGRTHSMVNPLDEEERIEEIARMLGGERATPKTRQAAEDMLVR
jgi:DNA repair protein RecN (Recombination protein N)